MKGCVSCIPTRERNINHTRGKKEGRSSHRQRNVRNVPRSCRIPFLHSQSCANGHIKTNAPLPFAGHVQNSFLPPRSSPPPHTAAAESAAAAYLGVIELEVSHAASERAKRCAVCLSASRCFLCKAPHDQQSRLATNSPACGGRQEANNEERNSCIFYWSERGRPRWNKVRT